MSNSSTVPTNSSLYRCPYQNICSKYVFKICPNYNQCLTLQRYPPILRRGLDGCPRHQERGPPRHYQEGRYHFLVLLGSLLFRYLQVTAPCCCRLLRGRCLVFRCLLRCLVFRCLLRCLVFRCLLRCLVFRCLLRCLVFRCLLRCLVFRCLCILLFHV